MSNGVTPISDFFLQNCLFHHRRQESLERGNGECCGIVYRYIKDWEAVYWFDCDCENDTDEVKEMNGDVRIRRVLY